MLLPSYRCDTEAGSDVSCAAESELDVTLRGLHFPPYLHASRVSWRAPSRTEWRQVLTGIFHRFTLHTPVHPLPACTAPLTSKSLSGEESEPITSEEHCRSGGMTPSTTCSGTSVEIGSLVSVPTTRQGLPYVTWALGCSFRILEETATNTRLHGSSTPAN